MRHAGRCRRLQPWHSLPSSPAAMCSVRVQLRLEGCRAFCWACNAAVQSAVRYTILTVCRAAQYAVGRACCSKQRRVHPSQSPPCCIQSAACSLKGCSKALWQPQVAAPRRCAMSSPLCKSLMPPALPTICVRCRAQVPGRHCGGGSEALSGDVPAWRGGLGGRPGPAHWQCLPPGPAAGPSGAQNLTAGAAAAAGNDERHAGTPAAPMLNE